MPRLLEVNNLTAGIKKDGKIFQSTKEKLSALPENRDAARA